jgi:HEAT repeat protein
LLGQGDRNLAGDILGDLDLSDVRPLRAGVVAIVASALSSADAEIRLKAAVALETAGPSARSAQPALVEAWRTGNAELRCLAIRALGAILAGPDALPVFLEALEDPIEQISIDAADGLGSLGALAAPAIPALIGRLRRNKLAHAASYALVKIGPPAAAPLAAALEGAPDDLRSWIAYTLGGMHGASEVAVPALERLLGDENDITRMNAAEALGRLGSPARPAVRALEAARHDAHAGVRRHAESALFKIGCSAEASDPAPGHLRILRRVITWDRHVLQQGPPALHGQLFCTRCRPR